jgi:hypothetical protein
VDNIRSLILFKHGCWPLTCSDRMRHACLHNDDMLAVLAQVGCISEILFEVIWKFEHLWYYYYEINFLFDKVLPFKFKNVQLFSAYGTTELQITSYRQSMSLYLNLGKPKDLINFCGAGPVSRYGPGVCVYLSYTPLHSAQYT